jgi:diguanylate cyclase (GGDEF)-like protein/PAS domain S-box-containing protein
MPLEPNSVTKAENELAGLRVIVADDDPASRRLVQHQLQKRGLDVYVAANGTEAWDLLQSGDAPTIAILDWVMPGPDGIELCRRIRSLKRKNYIYAILLTGKDDRQSLIEGLQAGADDYVCKPLDPFELEARVNVARRIIAFQNSLVVVQKRLVSSEEHYRNLMEASSALICIHDMDGNIRLINPAAAQSLGYTPEQVVGKNIRNFLDPAAQQGFDGFLEELREKPATSGRMAVRDSHGRRRIWVFTNRVMREEDKSPYVIGHAQDVTELIEAQNALQKSQKAALELEKRLSRNDPLTSLANRRSFYEIAEKERKRAARYERPLSVAYIDLDNFKQVNDTSGHQVGDQVLVRVAEILSKNIRAECLPARLGGDEFALLLPEADYSAANILMRKVHRLLTEAMEAENWPVTFSIGLATYNLVPDSTDHMLQAADKLMYKVKNEGKGYIAASIIEVDSGSDRLKPHRQKQQASATLGAHPNRQRNSH